MQKEKAREDKAKLAEERKKELSAAKKKRNAPPREDTEFKIASEEKPQKKRISFDTAEGEDTTEEHHAMRYPGDTKKKVKDFYELVDVVRFGERVEAPPVFDVVPNKNAAVTKLAAKLEREALTAGKQTTRVGLRKPADASSGGASRRLNNSIENERTWLLSGGGKAGEHKRLARLGLAPAATQHNNVNHAEEARKLTKEKEMQLLRQSVMATYQRNRSKEVQSKKGVDMKHEFPRFE
ncbi:hypothetical protein AGDE_07725 [Angomonas deanei]|uniref:Uncharacterized protein n=1 Tax=Angomonas deanei TaxID=59799 RepID=A0A7G2CID3_9TRYP|nr:hypothetical protein AGDE_07725 [Angomonas deanei]CAD2219608.1 hypothetical protein, conserved [Angomonas deanei]|eukprot:EPY34911.1 hypothetical protein AGDE_07725 [Angomonas deanei]